MLGILLFSAFIALGIGICKILFNEQPFFIRVWIGVLTGILGLMWGVIPFSFIFKFSILSHILALVCMIGSFLLLLYLKKGKKPASFKPDKNFYSLLCILIPVLIIAVQLLNSHILLPGKDGSLNVGQSTYGDLCLHLGITTSIATQGVFPPEYSIFPGQRLSYPFLADSLSSSLYLFGTPLRWAVLIPSYVLVAMLVTGFFLFALEILKNRHSALAASVLFFFNGGFGFAYFLEDLKINKGNFTRIFTEYYQTPTNLVGENIRWVNVICDMLIPQRTTLAGWTFLFLCLWLLYKALSRINEIKESRFLFLCSGIVAGLMPMIHTHSFMGLGIISILWFAVFFFQSTNKKLYITNWSYFVLSAAVLALPQLFYWTFPQSTGGGFIKLKLNWANDMDLWLWFWIKNAGLIFILALPALVSSNKKLLSFYSGALALFVLGEFILFQPNPYDNNKIFYIWYAFTVILVTEFCSDIYKRMKGIRARPLITAIVVLTCTFSATLSIIREAVSSYTIFDKNAVAAAEYIKENTPPDSLFITSDTHRNPVSSLAGRNVFSGTPTYLHFHGVDYGTRAKAVENMFKNPSSSLELYSKNNIDYIYFSSFEKSQFKIDPQFFIENYPVVFHSGDVYIFAVSARAENHASGK